MYTSRAFSIFFFFLIQSKEKIILVILDKTASNESISGVKCFLEVKSVVKPVLYLLLFISYNEA